MFLFSVADACGCSFDGGDCCKDSGLFLLLLLLNMLFVCATTTAFDYYLYLPGDTI